jgi:hypothetical protein
MNAMFLESSKHSQSTINHAQHSKLEEKQKKKHNLEE